MNRLLLQDKVPLMCSGNLRQMIASCAQSKHSKSLWQHHLFVKRWLNCSTVSLRDTRKTWCAANTRALWGREEAFENNIHTHIHSRVKQRESHAEVQYETSFVTYYFLDLIVYHMLYHMEAHFRHIREKSIIL